MRGRESRGQRSIFHRLEQSIPCLADCSLKTAAQGRGSHSGRLGFGLKPKPYPHYPQPKKVTEPRPPIADRLTRLPAEEDTFSREAVVGLRVGLAADGSSGARGVNGFWVRLVFSRHHKETAVHIWYVLRGRPSHPWERITAEAAAGALFIPGLAACSGFSCAGGAGTGFGSASAWRAGASTGKAFAQQFVQCKLLTLDVKDEHSCRACKQARLGTSLHLAACTIA